jgi:hypothetical protein
MYNKGYQVSALVELESGLEVDFIVPFRVQNPMKTSNILNNINSAGKELTASQYKRFLDNKIKKIVAKGHNRVLFTLGNKLYFINGKNFKETAPGKGEYFSANPGTPVKQEDPLIAQLSRSMEACHLTELS